MTDTANEPRPGRLRYTSARECSIPEPSYLFGSVILALTVDVAAGII